jgi:hypothetical protein
MPTPTGNLADMGKELAALSKLARRYDEITQQRQLANLAFDAVVRATPFNADHLKNIPKREEEFLYLAKEDPEEASLYFAIREIGWKFFATGALALMPRLFNAMRWPAGRTGCRVRRVLLGSGPG